MNYALENGSRGSAPQKPPLRVLFGGIYHETHTFIPGLTTRRNVDWVEGDRILDARGSSSPQAGAIAVADECGWQLIPILDARAGAGPTLADEVVDDWWQRWSVELQDRRGSFDAVFLALHGAMVSQSLLDVEGEMLRRIRDLVEPEIFIAGVTDLHGNFSPLMAQNADVLVTYRENPHTDGFESGERAARLLHRMGQSGERPRTWMARPPLLWTPGGTGTAFGPMRDLECIARAGEEHPDIWAVNVHGGFCFADTPHSGVSFSVVSVGSETTAHDILDELSECAWSHRAAGADPEPDLQQVLPQIAQLLNVRRSGDKRPVVVAEPSDNIGGGAPGDGTHLLRALLETDFANGGLHTRSAFQPPLIGAVLCDPVVVQHALKLAPHETARLVLGGHSGPLAGAPLELEVECIARGDGHFQLEDPHSHSAAGGDCEIRMGDSVMLRALPQKGTRNPAHILVTTRRTCPFDLGQWHCMGARPEAFDIIVAKAAVGHRQVYEPIAFALLSVGTPGPCASDLKSLPFRHVTRPTFPLDDFAAETGAKTRQPECAAT